MHELLISVIFYAFAALAVFSAFMVITQNNPVRCVLFLVVTFFASAVLWLLQSAEFLALILVLVYVGAVMTLFLFVVMMLNIDVESMKAHFTRYLPLGLVLVALLVGLLITALPAGWYKSAEQAAVVVLESVNTAEAHLGNTGKIGMLLYTDYMLAFELAAVLLLVAIVAAITLVHQGAVRCKRQNIVGQIMTRPEDRLTLHSMKPEK